MQRSIFRKAALDRLQSPEQLDQSIEITPPYSLRDLLALVPRYDAIKASMAGRLRPTARTQRIKTPTVLQMESVECGPAALAMVLGYYGRIVPLEELRIVCGVSRDGSKASNLIKAAHSYGLKAKGYKKEPGDLPTLPLPIIAFWNFNHYVVVEGFGPDRVYLNDPASGRRVVSAAEFDQAFTGVVLVFTPGPDFTPGGAAHGVGAAMREWLRGSERALVVVALLSLLLLIPGLLIPVLARTFVDDVLIAGNVTWLNALLIGLLLTALLGGGLIWLQQWYLSRLQTRLAWRATGDFVWHLLRLPVAYFTQRYAGEIAGRVALNERVARLLCGDFAPTALNAIVAVGYVALTARYDALLTILGVGIAALNLSVLRVVGRRQADGQRRLLQDQGQLGGAAYAALHSIETIKATGGESDAFARWAGYQAKVVNAEQAMRVSSEAARTVSGLVSILGTGAVLIVGSLRVIDGHLTVGMLVAVQTLLASFLQPFNRAATLGATAQDIGGSINRLDDVLRSSPDAQLVANELEETASDGDQKLSGHIELRNVTFGYSRMDPPLIEDLNLVVQPGGRVALVGGSGSGKSTVAKLIAGLYEPWSGEILFDGQPRGALPRAAITESLAMVDQEISLFAGTIHDNLTLWDDSVSPAAIDRAAYDAAIADEIELRPGGYGSLVDEGGRDLSGGQRQRLEIARALVRDPAILVLDEATSALDPLTEQIVDGQLRRRGCTCLIVAHRLSTIRDADEIIVLEHGKVIQRGTHEELRAVPGAYARLMESDAPESTIDAPILASVRAD